MRTMTKILSSLLLASVFSVAANAACPNYNGKYMCTGGDIKEEMSLKTEMIGEKYQYTVDDSVVLADGESRPVKFQGGLFDITASCTEESVTLKVLLIRGENDEEGCDTKKSDLVFTVMIQPDGLNLAETHYSESVCADGKVIPSPEKGGLSCVPVAAP